MVFLRFCCLEGLSSLFLCVLVFSSEGREEGFFFLSFFLYFLSAGNGVVFLAVDGILFKCDVFFGRKASFLSVLFCKG